MNKEDISTKLKRIERRALWMRLFAEDTPFKPKVVNRKDRYQRKPKHKNQDWS